VPTLSAMRRWPWRRRRTRFATGGVIPPDRIPAILSEGCCVEVLGDERPSQTVARALELIAARGRQRTW
jgi:hypothetical protein